MKKISCLLFVLLFILCGCDARSEIVTAQNENEKFEYSSIVIGSGNGTIKPIKTFVYSNEYSKDGVPLLFGDGGGRSTVFSSETSLSDFPTIVADGVVTVTSSAHSDIGGPRIYNVDYKEIDEYSNLGWDELHLLPSGEYIVTFYEKEDSRNTNSESETYTITAYENIFRLVIPRTKSWWRWG